MSAGLFFPAVVKTVGGDRKVEAIQVATLWLHADLTRDEISISTPSGLRLGSKETWIEAQDLAERLCSEFPNADWTLDHGSKVFGSNEEAARALSILRDEDAR